MAFNVLALLHFDAANNSEVYTNLAPGLTFSSVFPGGGMAHISTAGNQVFGTGFLYSGDSTGDGGIKSDVSITHTGAFCHEFWYQTQNVAFGNCILSIGVGDGANSLELSQGTDGSLTLKYGGVQIAASAAGAVGSGGPLNAIAVLRNSSNVIRICVNGASVASVTQAGTITGILTLCNIVVGGSYVASIYSAKFDEYRVTDADPRYTTFPYTVASAAFVYDGLVPATVQPFPQQTASVGGTATFAPSYGNSPTSYQWYRAGVLIPGATSSSYTTPTVTAADNGVLFAVIASNADGPSSLSGARLFVRDIKGGYGRRIGSAWQFKSSNRSARGTIQLRKQMVPGIDSSGGAGQIIWNDWWYGSSAVVPDTPVNPGPDTVVFTGYAPTLAQTANVTLIPGPDNVLFTGYAPTIAQPVRVDPLTGAITFTGYVPTVAQSALVSLTPSTGSLVVAGYIPTVTRTANQSLIPGPDAVVFTGYVPTIAQPSGVAPNVGAIGLTGYAPTIVQGITISVLPGAASLAFTTKAPGVARTANLTLVPDTGALVFAGYVPAVDTTSLVTLVPGTAAISLLGNAPSVTQGAGLLVQPGSGTFALATYAPTVIQTDYHVANPGQANIVFTGYAPVIVLDNKLSPAARTVALAGFAPAIAQPKGLTPGVGSVAFVGYAPTVGLAVNINPGTGTLAFTGYVPAVDQSVAAGINPGVGQITFTGYAPSIAQPQGVVSGTGSIVLAGYAPTIAQPWAGAPGTKAITLTGYAPTLAQTVNQSVNPGTGTLAFTGLVPTVTVSVNQALVAGTGTLTFTGYPPQVAQSTGIELVPDPDNIVFTGYPPTVTRQANVILIPDTGNITLTGYAPSVVRAAPPGPGASGMRRWLIQYYNEYFAKRDKEKALEEVSKELVKQASAGVIPMPTPTPVVTYATEQLATEAKQRREAVKKRHLDSEVKKMLQELSEEINPYSSFREPVEPIKDSEDDDDEDILLAIAMLM